jgi:transposase
VLHSSLRQRALLVPYASQPIQHRQTALTPINIKLPHVLSDVTGVTGMAILKAILAAERDRQKLAQWRDPPCQHSQAEIAPALQGNWRPEPRFALPQAVEVSECSPQPLTACDGQSKAHL